jgi:hypothetical protein
LVFRLDGAEAEDEDDPSPPSALAFFERCLLCRWDDASLPDHATPPPPSTAAEEEEEEGDAAEAAAEEYRSVCSSLLTPPLPKVLMGEVMGDEAEANGESSE